MDTVTRGESAPQPDVTHGDAPIVEALDALDQGYAVFDTGYRLSTWNAAFAELMELPDGLVRKGLSFEAFLRFRAERGDYGPDVEEAVRRRLALARRDRPRVLEHVLPSGRVVESRSTPTGGGALVTLYVDITQRRHAELERHASEERAEAAWRTLADAIDGVDAGIAIWDADGLLVTCNRRFREFYPTIAELLEPGMGREGQIEALVEQGQILDAVGREADWLAERRTARSEGGVPFEFRLAGGRWLRAYDHPTGAGGMVSIHIDVTADKEREAALAESERRAAEARRRLADAVNALGEGFALYDADDRLVLCNDRFRELLAPAADLLVPGTSWDDIVERMGRGGVVIDATVPREQWLEERRAERRSRTGSFQYRNKDGTWIRAIDRPTSDGGVVSIRIDITKLKERERELAEREERAASAWHTLSDAIESLGEGFAVFDADDRMVLCNASLRRLFGEHGHLLQPGVSYGEILDGMLAGGAFEGAAGREAEWKAERLARRAVPGAPFEYRTADGQWIRAIDRKTADGGTVSIRIDVSDLRRHERELAEKTRLLETTMDSMAQGIMVLGPDLRVRALNGRMRELMGVPASVARVGAHMAELFRFSAELGEFGEGEVEDLVNEQIVRLVTAWEHSFDHVRADGTRVKIRRTVMPDGGWVTTYTDVTAEAEAEARLARLAEISARNPNPVIEVDADGALGFVNDAAKALFKNIEQRGLDHPALAGVADALARRKPGRKKAVSEEISAGRRAYQRRIVPGRHRDGVLVCFNEVTELRRAERAQRRSQAEADAARRTLVEAIDSLSEGFALYDADDRLVICNERYRECYPRTAPLIEPGVEFETLIRHGVDLGEYADAIGREEEWIRTRLERHRAPPEGPHEQVMHDGRHLRVVENRTPTGGVAGLRVDITEQKRAEARLRESEERHRRLLEQLPDAVITHDGETITYANPAAARVFAADDPQALIGLPIIDLAPEDLKDEVNALIADVFEHGEIVEPFETRKVRLDGEEIQVEITGQAFVDDHGRHGIQAVLRDVTEQRRAEVQARRLEDQLRQAQKMEAIGTLAGGIAHDFNNILGAIIGYADLTVDDVAPGSTAAQNLDQIVAAGQRARDLVQQILSFSRREQGEIGPVRLNGIVEEVVRMLRPTVPATIEIVPRIGLANAVIEGRSGQIHQVLMNLATNAVQAIGQGTGRIAISLEGRHVDAGTDTAVGPLAEGDYYVLEVADTGTGMEPQTLARMFEPFFTTKGVGEGTGMGLAVVHGIVGDHGGAIDVESAPGEGTVMRVYLPRACAAPAAVEDRHDDPLRRRGQGRVLVVDDEAMIADMAGKVLERQGYAVERVYSALEALATLRERIADFDLLITDQTMPNLSGDALIREARRLAPSLPVILSSGYGRALSSGDALAIGADAFLAKTYSPGELCATVHAVLDGEGPARDRSNEPSHPDDQPHPDKKEIP